MNPEQWLSLKWNGGSTMSDRWLNQSKIIHNCDECPENKDFDDWEGKYPCGQQNCWVTCHCREIME